jgi:hypothetical protein
MRSVSTDALLEEMFLARRISLLALAAIMTVALIAAFPVFFLLVAVSIFLIVLIASTVAVCFYVYRISRQEVSLKYAIGHVLLCGALTLLTAFIAGVILVPVLIRSDVERLRQCKQEVSQSPNP